MTVLVTGGSGFLGSSVVPRLAARGDVVGLARSAASGERLEQLGARPVFGDLDDAASVDAAFTSAGADRLVNLASLGFGHAPTIVAAAEAAGLQRAVFVSTTAIFTSLAPSSKSVRIAAEATITSSALVWTIVRPTMIYGGPGDRNMWRLLQLLRRAPVVPLPAGGHRLQQPVHVDDLASAVVVALDATAADQQSYDVAGPDPLTLRDVVRTAAEAVGRNPRTVWVPGRPLVAALAGVERLGTRLPISAEQVRRLLEDKTFDVSAAARDLGYRPRTFAEGIAAEAALVP